MPKRAAARVSDLLRAPTSGLDLAAVDTRATPGFKGGKTEGREALPEIGVQLADLQERLYADGRTGGTSVLLVLQGMDTSGKGGTVEHVIGQVDPQGVHITASSAPTPRSGGTTSSGGSAGSCPAPGMIGVFDRSHYEDVLIVRVRELVAGATWTRRYGAINAVRGARWPPAARRSSSASCTSRPRSRRRACWRASTTRRSTGSTTPATSTSARSGTTTRRPTGTRSSDCNTDAAPWYVVPADRKWYRNWAIRACSSRR